jgi:hypothetical protein
VNDIFDEDFGITVSAEFQEINRLRERAGHDEASAIESAVARLILNGNPLSGPKTRK